MTNLFKFLESSLLLTLKMASDVGDPNALDGFIGRGYLRTSRIYTVRLLRKVYLALSSLHALSFAPPLRCYYYVQEIKYNGGVSSIGVLFIPCFVKIGQLVSKLKL